jgi:hypothetical protein
MNKLKNFPIVHYPNLKNRPDRLEFMQHQIHHYGLTECVYATDRYETFSDQVHVTSAIDIDSGQFGVAISYLNMMKQWYDTANEQYGFFCDDDVSFESIDNWNFSWQDLLDHLPENWQCVQLIRQNVWDDNGLFINGNFELPVLKLRKRTNYDWGTAFICKRSYVKKLLDRHVKGTNVYDFSIKIRGTHDLFLPFCLEVMLFDEVCDEVYNFPLFLENQELTSTLAPNSINNSAHTRSYHYYSGLWKLIGADLTIEQLLSL